MRPACEVQCLPRVLSLCCPSPLTVVVTCFTTFEYDKGSVNWKWTCPALVGMEGRSEGQKILPFHSVCSGFQKLLSPLGQWARCASFSLVSTSALESKGFLLLWSTGLRQGLVWLAECRPKALLCGADCLWAPWQSSQARVYLILLNHLECF